MRRASPAIGLTWPSDRAEFAAPHRGLVLAHLWAGGGIVGPARAVRGAIRMRRARIGRPVEQHHRCGAGVLSTLQAAALAVARRRPRACHRSVSLRISSRITPSMAAPVESACRLSWIWASLGSFQLSVVRSLRSDIRGSVESGTARSRRESRLCGKEQEPARLRAVRDPTEVAGTRFPS